MRLKRINSKPLSILINMALVFLSFIIFFGALEFWARYKYYGGHIKERGFYSRHRSYTPKKQTAIRIVAIGESTTQGGGPIAPNQTYSFYLEQILNNNLGGNFVEVLNSGRSATTTEYHRDFIKSRIDDQEPDILIVHSFYNHFGSFYPQLYNPKTDKIFIEQDSHKIRTKYHWDRMNLAEIANVFLMEHSHFYTRLREKILKILRKDINQYYAAKARFTEGEQITVTYTVESDKEKVLDSFVDRYYSAIEEIIQVSKSHGVEVVLIIPPYPRFVEEYKEDLMNFRPHQYYNIVFERGEKCLIELGERYNLLVIDADSEFMVRGRPKDLFLDPIHLTEKGHRLLAEIIVTKLTPFIKAKFKLFSYMRTARIKF